MGTGKSGKYALMGHVPRPERAAHHDDHGLCQHELARAHDFAGCRGVEVSLDNERSAFGLRGERLD